MYPKKKLRGLYTELRLFEKCLGEGGFGNPDGIKGLIVELKKEIRNLQYKADEDYSGRDERIVKDYGDGCVVRFYLPDTIDCIEDAEWYFDEYERLERPHSMYDCTGQHFTSWHKIFDIGGRWLCYHSIGIDI